MTESDLNATQCLHLLMFECLVLTGRNVRIFVTDVNQQMASMDYQTKRGLRLLQTSFRCSSQETASGQCFGFGMILYGVCQLLFAAHT
jgi:hypothetical protein